MRRWGLREVGGGGEGYSGMAEEVGSRQKVEGGCGPEAITKLEEKRGHGGPRTPRSWGGRALLLFCFFPPAGSRRHAISFEALGQGELPTCSLPSCLPCVSCWAPGPGDRMNVADPSAFAISCSPCPQLAIGSPLPEAYSHRHSPIPSSVEPSPFFDYFFSTLSLTAHLDPGGALRTSPAWPGV